MPSTSMSSVLPIFSPRHLIQANNLYDTSTDTLCALDALVDIADAELSSSWEVYDRIKQLRESHKTYVGLLTRYLAPLIQRIAVDNALPSTVTGAYAVKLVASHLAGVYVTMEW
jgi:hypothetical protein